MTELSSLAREATQEKATGLGVYSWLGIRCASSQMTVKYQRTWRGRVWPATVRAQVRQKLSCSTVSVLSSTQRLTKGTLRQRRRREE
eukprot:6192416-Pleurochrysis_carterae.AAC.2